MSRQKFGVEVIDVPMLEWVSERYMNNKSYRIFDEIWALTDMCFDAFGDYSNVTRREWDFVDRGLFFEPKNRSYDKIRFFHAASTSKDFSHKNTVEVIRAFNDLCKDYDYNAELCISGGLTDSELSEAKDNGNILIIKDFLPRESIAREYQRAHCILAPSIKEGLGLSFFEAKATGCDLITTDAEPMNHHTEYICKVISYNNDESLVPRAIAKREQILEQLSKYCKDFIMKNESSAREIEIKRKSKTKEEVEVENESLMQAFDASGDEPLVQAEEPDMNPDILKGLKEKMEKKSMEDNMPAVTSERDVSINLAVIGVGQAGSRIAEVFHKSGYDVGVINTSAQDLEFIDVMPNQKLLLEGSLGGTGKDLDLGREIFADSESLIEEFASEVLDGNDMVYLAISGGGGTGSSSAETLVTMLFNTGMPIGVIYVLPKATEDARSKQNSVDTLSRLAKMTASNMVSSLVVVDNARIEQIYANLSQSQFWSTSNKAIVDPLHTFNVLTSRPSRFTSLDPSDFAKIISCGDCSVYGVMEVSDYMEETALAEAVIGSLSANMLSEGFDLTQARVGGVIITGSKEVLEQLPAININYCFHMISEQTNGASIFQGVYDVESDKDSVKIYSWFAGLGLPRDRIESLRNESRAQEKIAAEKEKLRASAMNLDLGEDKVNSVADEVHRKIQKKKSGFSRLQRGSKGSIIDKRRKR
jgi:cell division GTPase FtsZ